MTDASGRAANGAVAPRRAPRTMLLASLACFTALGCRVPEPAPEPPDLLLIGLDTARA